MTCVCILHYQPYEERRDNYIELMNEGTILVVFNLCLGYLTDDSLLTGNHRQAIGYATIAIILLNITVNFLIFLGSTGIALYALGKKVWRGCAGKLRTKVGIKESVGKLPKLIDKEEAKN